MNPLFDKLDVCWPCNGSGVWGKTPCNWCNRTGKARNYPEELPPGQTRLIWHGTNKRNSLSIQKTGFLPGTYFARHLEDSLTFGGKYIITAVFALSELPDETNNWWQWRAWGIVPVSRIRFVRRYSISDIYQNNYLQKLLEERFVPEA